MVGAMWGQMYGLMSALVPWRLSSLGPEASVRFEWAGLCTQTTVLLFGETQMRCKLTVALGGLGNRSCSGTSER